MPKGPEKKSKANCRTRRRFDFVTEVVSVDEKTKQVSFILEPDPRRYEWHTLGGKKLLYDKFDKVFYDENILRQFAEALKGCPVNYEPHTIRDAAEYVSSRRPTIESLLKGKQTPPVFSDPSEEFLRSLEANKNEFVILSLDLIGSTKLATTLPVEEYSRVIQTVLFEIAEVIPHFHGHILKYTGDGIIAYFAAPSFITKNDLALDCALTLWRLVHHGLNPVFSDLGYQPIDLRIGLDSGEAAIVAIGSPTTKQHKDIIGAVVSLACKIQSVAPVGSIALGDTTVLNLHTVWRQYCREMNLPSDWNYLDSETGKPYRVHTLHFRREFGRNPEPPLNAAPLFRPKA